MRRLLPLLQGRWLLPLCAIAFACLLNGCQTPGDQSGDGEDHNLWDMLRISREDMANHPAPPPDDSTNGTNKLPRTPMELPTRHTEPGTLPPPTVPPGSTVGSSLNVPKYDLSAIMAAEQVDADDWTTVNFQFDAAELPEVVASFAMVLRKQYYIDPAVSGTVTFSYEGEMTIGEVWDLFGRLLWFNDAYVTADKGYIRVMNMEKLPRETKLLQDPKSPEQEIKDPRTNAMVQLLRFNYVKASEMAPLLTPYLSPKASVTPLPNLNALMVIDTPSNLSKLLKLVETLDTVAPYHDWPQSFVVTHYVEVGVIADELKRILPILGFQVSVGEKHDGQSIRLVPLDRIQALVVCAPTLEVVDLVKEWATRLDREDTGEKDTLFYYNAKHTKAEDLSKAIEFFFNANSAATKRASSDSGSGSGDGDSDGSVAPAASSAPKLTPKAKTAKSGDNAEMIHQVDFDLPVSVFVDAKHNRLAIRTTPRAYNTVLALLTQLDTPPLQVLIQMTISEIQLNKSTQFGIKYSLAQAFAGSDNYSFRSVWDYNSNETAQTDGLNLVLTKNSDPTKVFGMIEAVAGKNNTKVLFSPQVLAISDEEAIINVGDKVPIVTQENNATDSSNITREIQYQDTGIIMTVTPHVTANRMVTLNIKQEISDAVKTESSGIDSPTIQTRKVETSLIVEDNSTILLGGLIRTRDVSSESGIPGLQKIPYLGRLFQYKTTDTQRQELLLLMTVNVVDLDADVEKLTKRYQDSLRTMKETLSREYYGTHE